MAIAEPPPTPAAGAAVARRRAGATSCKAGRAALRDAFLARAGHRRAAARARAARRSRPGAAWTALPGAAPGWRCSPSAATAAAQLFPHSDVDVLLPAAARRRRRGDRVRRALRRPCSGTSASRSAHSVRTIGECEAEMAADVTVRTSLLEHRLLAGRARCTAPSRARSPRAMDVRAFYEAKSLEQQQRHLKYHDTAYNLEPNVKESPGGLRDLQTVLWIARAAGLGRSWRELARAGLMTAQRGAHGVAPGAPHRRAARAAALPRRPARGPAGVRPADRARAGARPRRHRDPARERAADAALLPGREAGAAGQRDPAAEPARAPVPDRRRSRGRSTTSSTRSTSCCTSRDEALFERRPAAMLDAFLTMQRHPELKGMSARTLRALWRNRHRIDAAFRRDPREPRALHADVPRAARPHARAAADEPLRHPRQLPAGVRPHRRPDAARPVPRLHGRRAHPDGDPQPAPLHRAAARARVPAVLAADRRFRAQGGALPRRAVPRHRQGPRRRPLDARRARRAPLLPRARPAARGRRARRVAGRAAPDDVGDGAEAGPLRPGRRRRVRRQGRRPSAGWSRSTSSPSPTSAARARRCGTRGRRSCSRTCSTRRARGSPASTARRRSPTACTRASSEAQRLLRLYAVPEGAEDAPLAPARQHLLPAPHRRRDRLARAPSVLARRTRREPVVGRASSRAEAGLQVLVYLPDQKELFARICGFFGAPGLSILEAKIHTTRHGYALDTFIVHDPADPDASYRETIQVRRVRADARAGAAAAARAARRGPRQPAPEALPADAGGPDLPRRQGHALHPRDRRRRPARPARARSPTRSPRPTSTSPARRSTRWASAPRTCS